jgi:hypothetical protein
MSNSRVPSPIRSSGPSKAGVAKRGRRDDAFALKPTAISIFISSCGVEMVKCSRCQRLQRACIVDPEHPSSCSGCIRDKTKCDSVGLKVADAIRLSGQIREAESKRQLAKAEADRSFDELARAQESFAQAKAAADRAERFEELLRNRRSELVRRGLESLEVEPDNSSGPTPLSGEVPVLDPSLDPLLFADLPVDPQFQADLDALFGGVSGQAVPEGS